MTLTPAIKERFESMFNFVQKDAHETAVAHGFWPQLTPVALALICSEAGEAIEADRMANKALLAEELADIVIRTMDLAQALDVNLAAQIVKKMKFNESRPFKHGKRY